MVKVREHHPLTADGSIDLDAWLARIQSITSLPDTEILRRACAISYRAEKECDASHNVWAASASSFSTGLEMAEILAELHLDHDSLVAAVLYRAVREGKLSAEWVQQEFGDQVAKLIEGVQRMAAIHIAQHHVHQSVLGQQDNQLHNVRKMLVAMIDDVQVVLIKLAERTCALRALKEASEVKRRRVAREIFDIYAPLAQRLGIGQLKWELEDLSFRYLHPKAYKKIASLLDGKRSERAQFIRQVVELLTQKLQEAEIHAEVSGRAKHIYSIWRKMKRKNVSFNQIYDMRAVRILVPTVKECYAVLGVVHGLWQHIPREFDDYIAAPKENNYRSLHTAVLGPDSKILEVQIRTTEMHDEAELGVCAHWSYKEGAHKTLKPYDDKLAWLRQVLEWQEELGGVNISDLVRDAQNEAIDEHIYVFTPKGHVVDLPKGATPLDFAYHVHTEVGHHCRGVKVNGRVVALTHILETGEQVEILTSKQSNPNQEWLNPISGYLHTARARVKVQQWFRQQTPAYKIVEGRKLIERELKRLAIQAIDWQPILHFLRLKTIEEVYEAIGSGALYVADLLAGIKESLSEPAAFKHTDIKIISSGKEGDSLVALQQAQELPIEIATCCQPLPGDPIAGCLSDHGGVSIHNHFCVTLQAIKEHTPERVVMVQWVGAEEEVYGVSVMIKSYDRSGLLRDIMQVLATDEVNVTAVNTQTSKIDRTAVLRLDLEVASWTQLSACLEKISRLPYIMEVQRLAF